jgi:histidine triad (HIT) family protein
MVKDCVFCKIIRGEIPCDRVYEDDLVLAFLDIAPLTLGHTLIIPKEHHTSVTTLPAACAARLMEVAPRLGSALMRATDAGGFNFILANGSVAGQVVPHVHLHVVPRQVDDGIVLPVSRISYPSPARKAEILAKARARLQ